MLIKRNQLSIVIILILSGGMFNSSLTTEEDAIYYDKPDFQFSKLFTKLYEIETYVSGCEKAMYKDGKFYNTSDVNDCKYNVTTNFDNEMEEFDKPNFKFFTIKNTDYRAKYTKDIYEISIIGTYCEKTDLSNILARETKCTNQQIGKLFMAQNINSNEWGFAAKGFETTNGKYLEVERP